MVLNSMSDLVGGDRNRREGFPIEYRGRESDCFDDRVVVVARLGRFDLTCCMSKRLSRCRANSPPVPGKSGRGALCLANTRLVQSCGPKMIRPTMTNSRTRRIISPDLLSTPVRHYTRPGLLACGLIPSPDRLTHLMSGIGNMVRSKFCERAVGQTRAAESERPSPFRPGTISYRKLRKRC